jgi:hypothetical protein
MDDELHPVVSAIAVVAAIGSGVFASVVTWVALGCSQLGYP